jgi:hypothetical protein
MARQPFVWEVHVRREMVQDELERLRQVPYAVWQQMIGMPQVKTITGRDERTYTMTVTATWASGNHDDIRVTATLAGSGLRRAPVRESFVVSRVP